MKVVLITPSSPIRRTWPYRYGLHIRAHTESHSEQLTLGTILQEVGHDVAVYDELYLLPDYRVALRGADVVCLCFTTSAATRAYRLADRFRSVAPQARIIMGGFHPSCRPEEALEHADQVIIGEGDSVIVDAVEGRLNDPVIVAAPVEDLDSLPLPSRNILRSPTWSADILTARGGTQGDKELCDTVHMLNPYRERSVGNVLAELRRYQNAGITHLNFQDDDFTANATRAKAICRGMIEQDLRFKECFFFGRIDIGEDEELLDLLQRAHLNRVLLDIESPHRKELETGAPNRLTTDIAQCVGALSHHDIRIIANLTLGMDTDTPQDIREAVDFAEDIGAYQIHPALFTPLPNMPAFQRLARSGRLLTDRWERYSTMSVVYWPLRMTPWELQELYFDSTRRFYTLHAAWNTAQRFGPAFGLRSLCLWVLAYAALKGVRFCSRFVPATGYYALRRLDRTPEARPANLPALPPVGKSHQSGFDACIDVIQDLLDTMEDVKNIATASPFGSLS